MSGQFYTRAPHQKAHSHFTNEHIAGFPDLDSGPSFEDREKYIKDMIKYQLFTGKPNDAERYINMRECFKLKQRKYTQFCLQNKVPGVSFEDAATELGLRKI